LTKCSQKKRIRDNEMNNKLNKELNDET
jgi:hypothetical protein